MDDEQHPIFSDPEADPDQGPEVAEATPSRRGARRGEKKRRGLGCLAALVVVALLFAGGALLVTAGIDRVQGMFGGPDDFPGPGSGAVTIEVQDGDSAAAIGRTLKAAGVVASVQAFVDAAAADQRSRGIQVGFYELAEEMSAQNALDVLVDPSNLIRAQVTVREGLTVDQIVDVLAENTDFRAAQFRRVLRNPDRLGLPDYAEGDPQGYLFPATYEVRPNATAESLLVMMVDRFKTSARSLSLEQRAADVGLSPDDVVTVASIIEREVNREEDLSGVAEVVENRVSGECVGTNGLLQMDSTVQFANGAAESVFTSDEERASDSPYNTYRFPGLPPGPIAAPGEAALEAALSPTDQGWCYFVAVNLETGETAFATDSAGHATNVTRLREWCAQTDTDLCS